MPAKRSSNDDSANKRNLIQGMEKMNLLSKEISSMTSQMEQWIQALTNLSYAAKDRDLLRDVISSLSKMQPKSERKNTKPTASEQSSPSNRDGNSSFTPVTRDGDSLFDIINSPSFEKIVRHVMEKKKKKG
ncbi:hypothetical protein JQC72_04065 [Polycladomyces sp. WAk]|uniref:Uncharacterized protein n=1 Tax=Polycladomyces zharkentensis TaxID=2807616 RepID=A0ABS2WGL1_9BACL|nr:hypothetical protein [Polycladomyces sp. WAk]MBN2908695.1 hypothetical protein [Polycladomyces sp. WAk]